MASTKDELLPRSLAIRQDVQVITQTLSLEHTTLVTHVTLGAPATSAAQAAAGHHGGGGGGGGGLSDAQVGAIVGSVVGVFILAFVLLCCFCQRGRPVPVRYYGYRRSRASYSGSHIVDDVPGGQQPPMQQPPMGQRPWTPSGYRPSPVQFPPPVAERVPGGPKYPTYRAIPIPNPRRPNVVHHD